MSTSESTKLHILLSSLERVACDLEQRFPFWPCEQGVGAAEKEVTRLYHLPLPQWPVDPKDVRDWLWTVARNAAVDEVRRTKRGCRFVPLPDDDVLADDFWSHREMDRRLVALPAIIENLPPQWRSIIKEKLEGWNTRDIAELEGISQSQVLRLFRKAYKWLAGALNGDEYGS